MFNALPRILCRGNNIENGFYLAKNFLNHNWSQPSLRNLKWFSKGKVLSQENCNDGTTRCERKLPTLICIQNPVTWLINKFDFKMLKTAWDPDFDEDDFKRGTKQAVAVICTLISKNLWDNLRGLVTRQALTRLRRDVEVNWSDEKRRNIDLKASDIKVALPRKIHFLKIEDQKFVDIDVLCIGMKFKEQAPSPRSGLVFIELVARFHRNYTIGELPNWTVTLFKVTKFNVNSEK